MRKFTPVFIISLSIILAFILWGTINNENLYNVTTAIQNFLQIRFGWFYLISATVILIFVIYLAFSKYGNIKLGNDDDEPEYSTFSWVAMLFSAGMGIGLVFWGVAEPVMHFHNPAAPSTDVLSNARNAITNTFFHWGLHPWGLYALIGLIIAYTTFRKDRPALISASVAPLFPQKYRGQAATIIVIIAIIATVFGVATSLGLGAQQIGGGLNFLFEWIPNNFTVQLIAVIL